MVVNVQKVLKNLWIHTVNLFLGRYLYLMTTNFSEKQRWVAALEAAVRSVQRHDRLSKNVRSLSP